MWPWGHLAVGYLFLSGVTRRGRRRPPLGREATAVALASLLPDLVDKPLAWTFTVLPNGRSLGHSLLTALVLVAIVWAVFGRRGSPMVGIAFGIGYLSHLLGDALYPTLAGEFSYVTFLAWPILPAVEYPDESTGILAHFASIEFTPLVNAEIGFAVLVALLWLHDGAPGIRPDRDEPIDDGP